MTILTAALFKIALKAKTLILFVRYSAFHAVPAKRISVSAFFKTLRKLLKVKGLGSSFSNYFC